MENGLSYDTFRNPPEIEGSEQPTKTISIPLGRRELLGEVLTKHANLHAKKSNHHLRHMDQNASSNAVAEGENFTPTLTRRSIAFVPGRSVGGTMSKGGMGTRNATKVGVDQLAWLASVKVGGKRGSSSGGGSRGDADRDSAAPSRIHSGSRTRNDSKPTTSSSGSVVPDRSSSGAGVGSSQRNGSVSRSTGDERKEKDPENQSLQEECVYFLYQSFWCLQFR